MKSQLAEAQTGFEPLFFHIQEDFQWQRPFSEGCGGEIPEKTKKNLSQSYGRWIVGFHEPMTSALFAFKKGAADWRLEMSEENAPQEEKFLREVEQQLLRKELDARLLEDGLIHVKWNGQPLCSVDRDGIVRFRPADKVVRVLRGIFNAAVDNNLIAKSPVPAILRIGGKATQEDAHR